MCQFIKENEEQCGRDAEPFCHQHEETWQASNYRLNQLEEEFARGMRNLEARIYEAAQERERAAERAFFGQELPEVCDDCEAFLRRTERLTEHPNQPRRTVFEAVIECDCSEHVLGVTSELGQNLPGGWVDG